MNTSILGPGESRRKDLPINPNESVTVKMDREAYYQVCNLVQLYAVVGVDFRMTGIPGPDRDILRRAFGALLRAGLPATPEENSDAKESTVVSDAGKESIPTPP
jgi:hypothetical protein